MPEFEKLADSYAADAEQLRGERSSLRDEVAELKTQIAHLEAQVAKLEADRQGLRAHLSAKSQVVGAPFVEEISPSAEDDSAEAPPSAGDVRFYKKVHSARSHDVLVRTQDCGCNNWESSHAADKARKGIAKLESNRTDWKALQHCASCTGGGMWKVRW